MVNFTTDPADSLLIRGIVDRAKKMAKELGVRLDPVEVAMDVSAAHANGCPLRLRDLLEADDFNFAHDIFGIRNHLNRNTGKIERFLPRFAQPQRAA